MGFILPLILFGILVLIIALVGSEGLWHATITFFNVMTAALLATNYFEPVSEWLDYHGPTFTYLIDYLVLWGLFVMFFIVFRTLTDLVSRVKVRFKRPVDIFGGYLVAAWTAWVLICFTGMSLHTAPLARNYFGGTFQETPETRMFAGLAPDRQWLALVHKLSMQSLRTGNEGEHVFDPQGDFILRYAQRRADYETKEGIRVNREVGQPAR
ncbi:MAG: CvpA family protein [Planctomycetia bacterium]|nr:CvpA family protein [Planctomycetia bacterium]